MISTPSSNKRQKYRIRLTFAVGVFVFWPWTLLFSANWQGLGTFIWWKVGYPPHIETGGWIFLGLLAIGLTLVAVSSSLGRTWFRRLLVVMLFGAAVWALENGLFFLTHLKALGPGRPLVNEMDVMKGIVWGLASIGLMAAGVKRLLRNRSEIGARNRRSVTVAMSVWAFVLSGAALLWIMRPQVRQAKSDFFIDMKRYQHDN